MASITSINLGVPTRCAGASKDRIGSKFAWNVSLELLRLRKFD